MVVELLRAFSEDEPQHIAVRAAAEQLDLDVAFRQPAAEAEVERHQFGVAPDARMLVREDDGAVFTFLNMRVREVCAISENQGRKSSRKIVSLGELLRQRKTRVLAQDDECARVRTVVEVA